MKSQGLRQLDGDQILSKWYSRPFTSLESNKIGDKEGRRGIPLYLRIKPIPSVRNILSSSVSRSRNGDSSLLKCVRTLGGGREKSALFALAGKRVILGRINEGKRIERGLFGVYYVCIYISGVSRGIHNAVLGVLQYVYDHTPTPWPNVISF